MTYTTIFEKLLCLFNMISTSWIYIAFSGISILLVVLLSFKKISKKTCVTLMLFLTKLVLGYTIYIYYEDVNNLINLGLYDEVKEVLAANGKDLTEIEEVELEPSLGNGGLGRLAACFLDSMASLDIPGHGCGIRYKYGFFEQKIIDCQQVEVSDNWLREGNVWEIRKLDKAEIENLVGV